MDSYAIMDDVELISFEEFKVWSNSLKYIVKPGNCLIMEYEGDPIGFIIAYRDRLPEIAALSRNPSLFNKIRFALMHRLGKGRLLFNYIGKKSSVEGKIKAVSPKLFAKLAKTHKGFLFTPVIVGYISEHSKTMNIVPRLYKKIKHLVMFEKEL